MLNINKIDFILLTHFHSDHYGNIINILRQQGSNYVISKECADKIGEMMRQCVIDGTAKELNNIPNPKAKETAKRFLEAIKQGKRDFRF